MATFFRDLPFFPAVSAIKEATEGTLGANTANHAYAFVLWFAADIQGLVQKRAWGVSPGTNP